MVTLLVDNRTISAPEGSNLLAACLENGIFVPNLCYLEGMDHPPASCRLCFVQIQGEERPATACTTAVREAMVVQTDTEEVRWLQRSALRLLLSVHHVDCAHCPANKRCALQDMAKALKVGLKSTRLETLLKQDHEDSSHPFLLHYPNRCVLCGRCVHMCESTRSASALSFAGRGFDTVISFYGVDKGLENGCDGCRACVDVCPVAALLLKDSSLPQEP